jgi:hypothetical protein
MVSTTPRGQRLKTELLIQRILGAIYIIAGVSKYVPALEDVPALLKQCADANANTFLASITTLLYENVAYTTALVAAAMISSGLVFILDRALVRAAAVGQILMLCCFVTIIHRAVPPVIVVDLLFITGAVYIFRSKSKDRSSPSSAA